MEQVSFVLPRITDDQMDVGKQFKLLANQATAVIIAAYLEHAAIVHGQLLSTGEDQRDAAHYFRINTDELQGLINGVQKQLSLALDEGMIQPRPGGGVG
jgi:hypothetical protein